MLERIADGVWVHVSECIQTNTVVVAGRDGVLVVDAGITASEMECLADDLAAAGRRVVAGYSTHPDWDHSLWHPRLGEVPRWATPEAAAFLTAFRVQPDWMAQLEEGLPPEVAGAVPVELFGLVTPLPDGAVHIPWDGPSLRVIAHRAHAVGHAALLVEDRRVLVAGDMLSDVLVPMPDLAGADDALGDYLAALDALETIAGEADAVVPGHGRPGDARALRARIDLDRAYIDALRDGRDIEDPRLGGSARPGWEWVQGIHDAQKHLLARDPD